MQTLMDAFRYYIALLLIVSLPGSLCLWLIIHPFIHYWRRAGPRFTLASEIIVASCTAYFIFRERSHLLGIQFGTNYWLVAAAVPLFAIVILLRRKIGLQLKFSTLVGLPEIAPSKYRQNLLTEGIYAHLRHPRYVQIILAVLAYALIANHLATYLLFVMTCFWVAVIVPVEERELRERYGEQWNTYAARVPRFLPTWPTHRAISAS